MNQIENHFNFCLLHRTTIPLLHRSIFHHQSINQCLDLQKSVKRLQFGSWEEEVAATEIRRLAQEDVKTRKSLEEIGLWKLNRLGDGSNKDGEEKCFRVLGYMLNPTTPLFTVKTEEKKGK